jgi:hypothetical protein
MMPNRPMALPKISMVVFQLVLSPISACDVRRTAMMMPNRPMALPKISMIRILTKSEELAASATAAPDPT